MKSAIINKALLCVCPPALLATSATVVPPVRKAVHHLTSPRHAATGEPRRRLAAAPALPAPCAPVLGANPIQPLATFAEPVPDEPVFAGLESFPGGIGGFDGGFAGIGGGAVSGIGGGGGGGTTTPVTGTTPVTAVPEPASWLLLLLGFGGLAAALRAGRALAGVPAARRRRSRSRHRRGAWALAGGAGLDMAAPLSATGVAATRGALLAKAALCVCPPALMVGTVATVPPIKRAVYAATAPRPAPVAAAPAGVPCDTVAAAPKPIKDIATVG